MTSDALTNVYELVRPEALRILREMGLGRYAEDAIQNAALYLWERWKGECVTKSLFIELAIKRALDLAARYSERYELSSGVVESFEL